MKAKEALATARAIANTAKAGVVSYDSAKKQCLPYLKIVNEHGQKVAKEFGQRYRPIGFSGLVR